MKILVQFLKVNKKENKIFNICSSSPIQIKSLIKKINKYSNYNAKVIFKPYRKGEMKKTFGDNKLILKTIKFNKFTKIENGIKKTLIKVLKFTIFYC